MESHAADAGAVSSGPPARRLREPIRRIESRFHGHSGLAMFRRSWLPSEPVRSIALVHGFGEHSGRYEHLGAWFAERGTAVHGFDLRGHGRSGGRRGHVNGFADYLNDLEIFLEIVHEASEDLPVTLLGHSLGGLIVTAYAVERNPSVNSVVTSGAALKLSPDLSRSKVALARLIYKFAPRLGITAGLEPADICSDPEVVRRYIDDPLVHGTMTTSHAVAMMDQIERLQGAGARVEVPMFLAHGAADRLCLPSGSSEFHQSLPGSIEASTAPRAELRIYPGNFHEIFNDVDQTTVFADVLDWMERCGKDARGASDREGSSHVR